MSRELFGTDGIRGLAGQYPLDDTGAEQVGRAVGTHFAKPGQEIVLAWDPRESSAGLVEAITKGLTAVGVNVTMIGVLPTPGLAYVTRQNENFVAGVMVTASHNPYQYNGIKVFDSSGDKLSDETEAGLNGLIKRNLPDQGPGKVKVNESLAKAYEDFLVSSVPGKFDGLKVAVDSANGAASNLAAKLFEKLGASVTPLADKPDGRNINDGCGATNPESLKSVVLDKGLDIGIALDGDADRLVMIDGQGREVNGDNILYILAVSQKLPGVVTTVMSNLGLEHALSDRSIKMERTGVGDRYVLEGLAKTGYQVGGEQSGHIILSELLKTGDGLLAAVQVLAAVVKSGKDLAGWRDEVKLVPQALVNLSVADKSKLDKEAVKDFIAEQERKLGDSGRLLIRPSGTEPVVRVMVEAPDAQSQAESISTSLKELL